ncbi:unnamed protein product [Calypogeia fissa]
MSSSTNPPVLCTICDSNGTQFCTQCRTLRYCSKECQRIDWPTHKLLCRSFSDFRTPPGPTFKRAILFPVSEKTPKFIWLKILTKYDEEGDYAYESPQLEGLLEIPSAVGFMSKKTSFGTARWITQSWLHVVMHI